MDVIDNKLIKYTDSHKTHKEFKIRNLDTLLLLDKKFDKLTIKNGLENNVC